MPEATDDFFVAVEDALRDDALLAATLSKPADDSPKLTLRPVDLDGGRKYQWTTHAAEQTHENLDAAETLDRLRAVVPDRYLHTHVFTAAADLALLISKRGRAKLQRKRPSKAPTDTAHNRTKQYLLDEAEPLPWLVAAGVQKPDGGVRARHRDKFRQLNRFLELVDDITDELPTKEQLGKRKLKVVEFGAGRGLLAYGLHHLLTKVRRRSVETLAVDRKESVVDTARDLVANDPAVANGLCFATSDIADLTLEAPLDLAVWLHACDTATDDAIAKSIQAEAKVILAVPCCQHEIHKAMTERSDDRTDPLTEFGLVRERYAALATDALRANALKRLGYRVQVVEFIDMQHTAKNVLIRAVRRDTPADSVELARWRGEADQLKERLGIERWRLEEHFPTLNG